MADLRRVSVGVKTFLRDNKFTKTLTDIIVGMPEVEVVVADDGIIDNRKKAAYTVLRMKGHKFIECPFDSGFGYKSNKIADAFTRDYLLIGADDFDFEPRSVRNGIEALVDVLDKTDIDIASGRVRGPYEFTLEDLGDTIIEHRVRIEEPKPWYVDVDLTVNFSLIKRRVFEKVRWDDDVKISGGEHGAFFTDVKRAGFKVAYVPGVQISEQEGADSDEYVKYRTRGGPERPCFVRRGIKKYILGSGYVDYDETNVVRG